MHYVTIVGVGGTGGYLAPVAARMLNAKFPGDAELRLVDADIVELKNVNRQIYTPADEGRPKAECLCEKIKPCAPEIAVTAITGWFTANWEFDESHLIIVCADNAMAQKNALAAADTYGCQVIIGGCSTDTSCARYYRPAWKDTPLDPRMDDPDILTDIANDPTLSGIADRSCASEMVVRETGGQTAATNFMTAAMMSHLLSVWCISPAQESSEEYQPVNLWSTRTRMVMSRVNQMTGGPVASPPQPREFPQPDTYGGGNVRG